MRLSVAPHLEHRRVFASRDPEQTRAFMQAKEFGLDLHPRDKAAFDFAASAAYLPNSYIGYIRYGSAAQVRVPEERKRDDFLFIFRCEGDPKS